VTACLKQDDFAETCAQKSVFPLPSKSSTVGGITQLSSCLGYHGLAGQALKTSSRTSIIVHIPPYPSPQGYRMSGGTRGAGFRWASSESVWPPPGQLAMCVLGICTARNQDLLRSQTVVWSLPVSGLRPSARQHAKHQRREASGNKRFCRRIPADWRQD
jgi:hypothetical protein